jgi:hypothetical protein
MPRLREEQIIEYLRRHPVPGLDAPLQVREEPAEPDEQRFRMHTAAGAAYILKRYDPGAVETARREIAGLRLGSELAVAPALLHADEAASPLGGPTLVIEQPAGRTLGRGRLGADDARSWLFLLLMLHHLTPGRVEVTSSMSADAAAWWQRSQPAWDACRAAYADARFAPLLAALTRLHAIVGVHIEAHRSLWMGLTRRPCHGNPVPEHVLLVGTRPMFVEWNGFGLGDPAMEVGRVAALAALSGELSAEEYVRFVSDYLSGMRDIRDESLKERVHVFASILPLGFSFAVLQHLAQGDIGAERADLLRQIERALIWIQDTLGVVVGKAPELLAPLRVPA